MPEPAQVIAFGTDEVTLKVDAVSDIGAKRAVNEDSFLATAPVFLVADGMGGHAHGDLASQAVVRLFSSTIVAGRATTVATVLEALKESNVAVHGLSDSSSDATSMAGTTVAGVALVAAENQSSLHWMVFNVGDSRVYSWDGDLAQLTVDHSAVQELIEEGSITASQAATHPERNIVTRAIGVDGDVEADVWLLPAGGRQIYIVCSDGLTKEVSDDLISELVKAADAKGSLEGLASRLVHAAIEAGGLDNVSVIVVDATVAHVSTYGECGPDVRSIPAFLEQTLPRA